MKKTIYIPLVLIFVLSCNTLVTVQKRKHLHGYYVSISNSKKDDSKKDKEGLVAENKKYKTSQSANDLELKEKKDERKDPQRPLTVYKSEENIAFVTPGNSSQKTQPQHNATLNKNKSAVHNSATLKINSRSLSANGKTLKNLKRKQIVSEKKKSNSNSVFLFFSGLLLALTTFSFLPAFSKSHKASFWAKNNRGKAKGIILASEAIIGASGFYLGNKLSDYGISTSDLSTNLLFGFAAVTTLLYPAKNVQTGLFNTTYKKQKLFSLLLTLSGFLLLVSAGNRNSSEKHISPLTSSVIHKVAQSDTRSVASVSEDVTDAPLIKKPKYGNWELVGNIFLTLLALVGLIGLVALVALFSCALYCNGQGAIATALLIFGWGSALFLFVYTLKVIWKPKNKENEIKTT